MDVVAAGAVTVKDSGALPVGSKDLTLGTVVSSVDPSLLLHFWWNNSPEVVSELAASFKD